MEASNPYQAPDANLETTPGFDQYDTSSVFSPRGRFGRLSYLAWGVGMWTLGSILISGLLGFSAASAGVGRDTFGLLDFGLQIPLLVVGLMFAIRRLHDIDMSGWWILMAFVPVVNVFFGLYMILKGGTDGPNRFGAPRFTPAWEKIAGAALPALALVGILAAIAIPAYNSYIQAAAQASGG